MKLFTDDYQPFSVVEDKGFKEFVQALNPAYQLPNRKTISKTLIPALYEECKHSIKLLVSSGKSFCITTDCWTSLNTTSYIAVTAHFINENFQLISILLECSAMTLSHTSENLSYEINKIITEWNIEGKILLAVSDNANNIKSAITNLGLKHFGCFAHTLNLIVTDGLKVEAITIIINKVKTIVSHFRRSCLAGTKLNKFQENEGKTPLKLIQDVITRWNSTFHMLDRFIELESAIKSTLALLDVELPALTFEEWKIVKQLCTVLKPFYTVTNTISGEMYCTVSMIIPLTNGLNNVIFLIYPKKITRQQ